MDKTLFLDGRLGDDLYNRRVAAGCVRKPVGLRETALDIRVSASTLCRIELGETPSLENFVKCCRWLGVSMDSVLEGWNPE